MLRIGSMNLLLHGITNPDAQVGAATFFDCRVQR